MIIESCYYLLPIANIDNKNMCVFEDNKMCRQVVSHVVRLHVCVDEGAGSQVVRHQEALKIPTALYDSIVLPYH